MINLNNYLGNLKQEIDESEDEQQAVDLSNRLFRAANYIRNIRHFINGSSIEDVELLYALSSDFEHIEVCLSDESDRAKDVADEHFEISNEEPYEDQHRSDYYASVL